MPLASIIDFLLHPDLEPLLEHGSWVFVLAVAAMIFAESGLLVGVILPGDSLLFSAGLVVALPIMWYGTQYVKLEHYDYERMQYEGARYEYNVPRIARWMMNATPPRSATTVSAARQSAATISPRSAGRSARTLRTATSPSGLRATAAA